MNGLLDQDSTPHDLLKVQVHSFASRLDSLHLVQSNIEELMDDEADLIAEVEAQADFDDNCDSDTSQVHRCTTTCESASYNKKSQSGATVIPAA